MCVCVRECERECVGERDNMKKTARERGTFSPNIAYIIYQKTPEREREREKDRE